MDTVVVKVLNKGAMRILKELERLRLISLDTPKAAERKVSPYAKYAGKISSKTADEMEKQLQESRDWR